MILTYPNILSALRAPLALFFIWENTFARAVIVVLAMLSDCLDGYLARRYKTTSQFGACLDPIMDKFFVIVVFCMFILEGKLEAWQALVLLSRDFGVLLFGIYLILRHKWTKFRFHSIWSGKISTTLQFLVMLALIFQMNIPSFIYSCFIILGFAAFFELYLGIQKKMYDSKNQLK
ncbi:MAG: CDP-alcohol phosphatidyltransferase family protein [Parachlamydiaceae bacterium]|nr:CDP-alcohol phosphatidyltransferase family protein [Parachlamydiaceae bacterium]